MKHKFAAYKAATALLALSATVALFRHSPAISRGDVSSIALLSVLALTAEFLAVAMPNSASGSIAFIPYLAAALVVPSWATVAGVVAVRLIVDAARRRKPSAALFNLNGHVITAVIAIWTYTALGGRSLLLQNHASLFKATMEYGFAAIVAVCASFVVNSALACGYYAVSGQQTLQGVWRRLVHPTIAMDLLASPIVFIFAWLYAAHGAIAAAALWVPLLGLREVHKMNVELQRTNEELLQLMIKSIEARDLYTSGHSRRVQRYSTIIARGLGLSEREIELVAKAALLHDVGKIYEKYGPILRKADKLTAEEWSTMQEHPTDGANLVATMSGLKEIIPAIRHHHENWDGSGYPDGLAEDRIPVAARIIAFADTIDAMTSERPYRRPLTETQVRAEIIRCRGRQFDPSITDRLIGSSVWLSLFQPERRTATPERGLRLLSTRRNIRETA